MKKIIATSILFFASFGANAYTIFTTGNDFVEIFDQDKQMVFMIGVVDSFTVTNSLNTASNCVLTPKNVSKKQLLDITTNYIKAHTEERHLSAAQLIIMSMFEAFRCGKK